MRKRSIFLLLLTVAIVVAVNAFAYTSVLNGSNTIINLIKKFNFAYVTPNTYYNLAKRLPQRANKNSLAQQLDAVISDKSGDFIEAAFKQDNATIEKLLDSSAQYIRSKDGSSFIRYIGNGTHVEGYMATDKKLLKAKQRWHVMEEDNTVTCSMEVYIEDMKSPQLWYLHFKKVHGEWKIYMLENGI